MKRSRWILAPSCLLLGLFLLVPGAPAQAPPQPAPENGGQPEVTVRAHGPVHEAFAEPGSARPPPSPIVPKRPPEPIPEVPPDEKPDGANVQWIPGYWAWDDDSADFLWV